MPQTHLFQDAFNKAYNDFRSADRATRLLLDIQYTARQLAARVAEYEELTGGAQEQHPGIPGPGQPGMGDDGGA